MIQASVIQASDIDAITAVPGGVELVIRAASTDVDSRRQRYTVEYDWEAAQRIYNALHLLLSAQGRL